MGVSSFSFVRPIAITDAMLTSSTVPEAVAATYAGGTTYALGDRVGLAPVDGQPQIVYESLQAANTGHTPASSPTWWKISGNVYPAYSAAVTYGLGDVVSNIGANVHELYESLSAGNVGNALTLASKWLNLGATNRWKMFDQIAASQTTDGATITTVIAPGVLVNSAVFANLSGTSIRVQQSISGYDRTIELNSHVVADWYAWFYEPIQTRDEAPFMDVPPFPAAVLTITLTGVDGVAACGVCVLGQAAYVGETQWGFSRSINDYSRVTEDAWGGLVLTPGGYSKLMSVDVHIPAGYESHVTHLLTGIRATIVMFVATTEIDSATIYGTLGRNWTVPFTNVGGVAKLEIRGLT